jgi:hypothetical protein
MDDHLTAIARVRHVVDIHAWVIPAAATRHTSTRHLAGDGSV